MVESKFEEMESRNSLSLCLLLPPLLRYFQIFKVEDNTILINPILNLIYANLRYSKGLPWWLRG